MSKPLKTIGIAVLILGALGGLGAFAYTRLMEAQAAAASLGPRDDQSLDVSIPVSITRAERGPIREVLALNGTVQPVRSVSVFSSVPGKIKSIAVKAGDRVRRGQVLALVERDEAGLRFADAPVESTIGGIVERVLTEQGAAVNPSAPLFQVVDMDSVEVVARVPEKHVQKVRPGLRAEVRLISYPDRMFTGTVGQLSPVLDPASRTREARILVNNPELLLKPGMFGSVDIIVRAQSDAVLIPYSAIIERDGQSQAFLAVDGKAVEVRPVLDIVNNTRASVTSGIQPGDAVVVIGQHNLNDGDAIAVAEEIE